MSFWPDPFIIGIPDGDINVGDNAILRRSAEDSYPGIVRRIEFHRPSPEKLSISISGSLAEKVEEGDLILIDSSDDALS